MRNRWALWGMLASALAVFASLYLPWVEGPVPSGSGVLRLLNLVSTEGISGWASGVGYAAALAALALAAASVAVLTRPSLADRLPLAACALSTAYFAVAGLALLRQHYTFDARLDHAKYPWAYGAYLGLAASAVAVLAATAFSGRALLPRGALDAVGRLMGLGLLVSFLLLWHRVPAGLPPEHGTTLTFLGIVAPSVVLAAVMVIAGGARVRAQALCWVGAAVFTFGAFGFGEASLGRAYGFWLALAFALALLIAATVALRESPRPTQPALPDAVLAGAATLFIVSLFLPWQQFCVPQNRCFSAGGWTMPGSSAAVLAALAGAAVLLRSHVDRVSELAAAMGLLVATAGFTMSSPGPGVGLHFAYGSIVGFSATALLVAVTAARSGRPRLDRRRWLARLLPIAASLALIGAVALPWWGVLPSDWAAQSTVLRDWFAVAGLLLSLHLLWCWLRRVRSSSRVGWELALVPSAVLALVSLELIAQRDQGMTWGGGILVGLCLLLTALGWIEVREGLEDLRVPEILRVDRLPGAET